MKLPWVSREHVAAVESARAMQVTYFEKVIADLREDYATLKAENADLLSRLLSMKASGFVLPEVPRGTVEPDAPLPAAEPDELLALIHERSPDPRVRAMMLRQLAADRKAGLDPHTIRDAILNGVQSEGVPL